jgi:hypothetical protein
MELDTVNTCWGPAGGETRECRKIGLHGATFRG